MALSTPFLKSTELNETKVVCSGGSGGKVFVRQLINRVLALPGSDDSKRGLTVDAWIVTDEAARPSNDLIASLRPIRARRPDARFAMLSTAWSRTDPFWMGLG